MPNFRSNSVRDAIDLAPPRLIVLLVVIICRQAPNNFTLSNHRRHYRWFREGDHPLVIIVGENNGKDRLENWHISGAYNISPSGDGNHDISSHALREWDFPRGKRADTAFRDLYLTTTLSCHPSTFSPGFSSIISKIIERFNTEIFDHYQR